MPTFNQSKPGDEGEPAGPTARQVTADERELMLQTVAQLGLPPEVVDAYVAGGTFTGTDAAVKHFRALGAAPASAAAPAPHATPKPAAFTLAYEDGLKIQVMTIDQARFVTLLADTLRTEGVMSTGAGASAPTGVSTRGLHRWYPTIPGEFSTGVGKEAESGKTYRLAADTLFQVWAVLEPDRRAKLALPIRRSETAVERDDSGGITRSVTVERDA